MPRRPTRGRVPAGVVRRQDRGGECYIRLRVRVYEDEVLGIRPPPLHRALLASREVYHRASHPHDWQASVDEAAQERRRIHAEMLAEQTIQREQAEAAVTLAQAVEHYEADARRRGIQMHVKVYQHRVILDGLGRSTPAGDLTADQVLAWLEGLRQDRATTDPTHGGRPLGRAGVNGYIVALQAILNLAERHGLIEGNPVRRLQQAPTEETAPVVLSVRQMAAVLASLSAWEVEQGQRAAARELAVLGRPRPSTVPLRGLVLVGYYTLGRSGRVRSVRWEDVDLEARTLTYPRTKNRLRVTVPIYGPLLAWLQEQWPGPGATGWVVPNPRTGEPFREVRPAWRRLLELANARLGPGDRIDIMTPIYNLRHTGATHMAATGRVSPIELAQLMGDPRVTTVERRYFGSVAERFRASLSRAADHEILQTMADAVSLVPTSVPTSYPNSGLDPSTTDHGPPEN